MSAATTIAKALEQITAVRQNKGVLATATRANDRTNAGNEPWRISILRYDFQGLLHEGQRLHLLLR